MVFKPGSVPNWLGSAFFNIAGFRKRSTTYSSPTLERIGVREIGLRSLFTSLTGFCLGIATTSASFHEGGKRAK